MANSTLRVAALGLTHDHVWRMLDEARDHHGVELVAAADPHQELLEKFSQQYGLPTHVDAEALLERQAVDAVIVCSDNALSVDLIVSAAARGLHVMVEKPLAADLYGADMVVAAAAREGVRVMVNWPFAWWPSLRMAIEMANGGTIGDIWQVKYRAAHGGPAEMGCSSFFCDWLYDRERNGGGAVADYCCYGAALSRCLLGLPSRVSGVVAKLTKKTIHVDDNGVLLMRYPHALAIAESSWSQVGNLTSYTAAIYGTRGTLIAEAGRDGRLLMGTPDHPDGVEVHLPQLERHDSGPIAHFHHAITTEQPFFDLVSLEVAYDTQQIITAGLKAAADGRDVSLPLR